MLIGIIVAGRIYQLTVFQKNFLMKIEISLVLYFLIWKVQLILEKKNQPDDVALIIQLGQLTGLGLA